MQIVEWLADPARRAWLLPPIVAGVGVVLTGAMLSPLVAVKRLAFVGQGVSHCAFGGVGVAAWLGLMAPGANHSAATVIVLSFCVLAALAMGLLADRRGLSVDTAIGLLLVASMAGGFALLHLAQREGRLGGAAPIEGLLFGQLLGVGWTEALGAWSVTLLTAGALAAARRPLVFWAVDEGAAPAFGVPGQAVRLGLMVLLALAVVTAMSLAGVVLAAALLLLPGATALQISHRLGRVVALSAAAGLISLALGLTLSLEIDLPLGPSVVLAMTALLALSGAIAWGLRRARASARVASGDQSPDLSVPPAPEVGGNLRSSS